MTKTLIAVGSAQLSDDDPQALGTAASGSGSTASRADHVHPTPNRARGAYDAIVYIQDGEIIAEDATGAEISSGTSTGTGSEQTIAHGLAFTPTKQQVILIAGSATANPYHSSAPDATNIYVTAGSGQEWYWNVP